jgi:hypothetical protein
MALHYAWVWSISKANGFVLLCEFDLPWHALASPLHSVSLHGTLGMLIATERFMRHKSLALLALYCSSFSHAQTLVDKSVESGTLVMAARTASSVIISVDNKVTPPRDEDLANPQVKMLDVGQNSACAVDGILYQPDNGVDIMRALRQWINALAVDALSPPMEEI